MKLLARAYVQALRIHGDRDRALAPSPIALFGRCCANTQCHADDIDELAALIPSNDEPIGFVTLADHIEDAILADVA